MNRERWSRLMEYKFVRCWNPNSGMDWYDWWVSAGFFIVFKTVFRPTCEYTKCRDTAFPFKIDHKTTERVTHYAISIAAGKDSVIFICQKGGNGVWNVYAVLQLANYQVWKWFVYGYTVILCFRSIVCGNTKWAKGFTLTQWLTFYRSTFELKK